MKSRAELLAELEEKRRENNSIPSNFDGVSITEAQGGYDPYDNPGIGKEFPDGIGIAARRRRALMRKRRS